MDVPLADIESAHASHERLRSTLADLTDADVRRPSRLPAWTVGHVLTHMARHADSVIRRLDGARRGEVADQYEGGPEGRAARIAGGAGRSRAELVDDVLASAAALEVEFATFPADRWDRLARSVYGVELPVVGLPFQRMREVEVHHVDLGLGYGPDQWPPELAARWLPEILDGLAARADSHALLAWTLRRGPAPDLAPY